MCLYYYGVAVLLSCSLSVFLFGPLSGEGAHVAVWREGSEKWSGWKMGGGEKGGVFYF